MNLFTVLGLLSFGIASAQFNSRLPRRFYDCVELGSFLNHNYTWTCRNKPCRADFALARAEYEEYQCDTVDKYKICCPEITSHSEGGLASAGIGDQEKQPKSTPASVQESERPGKNGVHVAQSDPTYSLFSESEKPGKNKGWAPLPTIAHESTNAPEEGHDGRPGKSRAKGTQTSTPGEPTVSPDSVAYDKYGRGRTRVPSTSTTQPSLESLGFDKYTKTRPKVTPATAPQETSDYFGYDRYDRTRPKPSTSQGTKNAANGDSQTHDLQGKQFNKFDRDLLFELAKANRNKNIIVSPASVKSLLALLVEGSSGETASELLRVLQLKPDPRERESSLALLRKLVQSLIKNERAIITLESQSRIYRSADALVKENYEKTLKSVYNAGIELTDFSKADQAADAINKWIKDVTRGLIPKVVERENINQDTKLFLLNYIYLKANWDMAFNPSQTRPRCFYPTEKECLRVKFMYKKRTLNYADSQEHSAEIFEIPFKDPRYTIVFMLPHKGVSVYEVLTSLEREDLFKLFNKMEEDSINLSIPRTVIGFSSNLVQTLQQMNVKSVFGRNAKLDYMLQNSTHFGVSEVVHKARIELNEEGAEAAGVAGANIQTLSLDVDRNVNVDRPFLFFIRDTTINGFLFEGIVFSPDKAEGE